MSAEKKPEVIDLSRYRKAAEDKQARQTAAAKSAAPSHRMLGARKNAGLILVLVILACLALWLGPPLVSLLLAPR
jgi:ferric-dicitrate binding protein FerR (iron transport regulator)